MDHFDKPKSNAKASVSRLFQFRISTALVLLTLVATGLALLVSLNQQRKLTAENRELRSQTGRPVIVDAKRIAVGVQEFPAQWGYRFRVYRPPGRRLVLRCAFKDADQGFPADAQELMFDRLQGSELKLEFALSHVQGEDEDSLSIAVDCEGNEGGGVTTGFAAPPGHWSVAPDADPELILSVDEIATHPGPTQPDIPFVLLRLKGGTTTDFKSGRDRTAVLIWLDELEPIDESWHPSPWRLSD